MGKKPAIAEKENYKNWKNKRKMAHKIMPYILPIASIMVIAAIVLVFKPQVTGFFVASPQLNAEIRITADEVLPENAEIHIFLEKNGIVKEISTMAVSGFVNQFPENSLEYKYGSNHELEYGGFGYLGSHVFNITINTDGLKGEYMLKTEIYYGGMLVSETQQEVEI